jgi:type 1 glutamine amidotransferase
LEFDREVLGGNYRSHHPVGQITQIKVATGGQQHPILKDVELKQANDSLYKNEGHAADINVLLTGTIPGQPTEPLAWTRDYKGGRIFYTSLGAEDTFQNPAFRRMLANALFWTAGRDVAARKP